MKFGNALLCTTILVTYVPASPLPSGHSTPYLPSSGWFTPEDREPQQAPNDLQVGPLLRPHPYHRSHEDLLSELKAKEPHPPSPLLNLALFAGGSLFLLVSGLGISEWALNWYSRIQKEKAAREKRVQEWHDDQARRKKERERRERAMDLLVEMAENHADKVTVDKEFDGDFEPYLVPEALAFAVKNVLEQTEDGGEADVEALEMLKTALKSILTFEPREGGQQVGG